MSTRKEHRVNSIQELKEGATLGSNAEGYTIINRRRCDVNSLLHRTYRSSDPVFQHGWFVINTEASHTFYVVDQKTQLVQQAIRIRLFSDMTKEEYSAYQLIASHWRSDSQCHGKITSNAAAKKGTGLMYAAGWRTGYECYKDIDGSQVPAAYGSYAKKKTVPQNSWLHLRTIDRDVHALYGAKFRNLLPQQFATQQAIALDTGIPMLGSSALDNRSELDIENLFGPTATYTFGSFYNALHVDNDSHQHMAFGIFLPVCLDNSFTLLSKADGYAQLSGGFVDGTYKTIVDFASIDGAVEMAWWGSANAHCTLEPEWLPSGIPQTHLGSSVQVSRSLERRISHLKFSGTGRMIINDIVRDKLQQEGRI